MTIAQYITSAIASFFTLYYAPALWRKDERLTPANAAVWTVSILACVIACLGVRQ